MGFFDKLFKSNESNSKKEYLEKDNKGTRQDNKSKAIAYWNARIHVKEKDPFVLGYFDNSSDAKHSLLDLPFIHLAKDSNDIICSEVLEFGYYEIDGVWEAIVCGKSLDFDMFSKVEKSFLEHNGKIKNSLEPDKTIKPKSSSKKNKKDVKFLKKESKNDAFGENVWEVYSAPNKESAIAFLEGKVVSKNFYYIVVETPEGNFGRDINGFYQE
ncbi:hypothetical protein [Methanobrevibacter sp. DSM 116169]|uniref:hypothetical protein n=1 Tax=Methanobrevibacter sp. DSM 116169 TaxID=3242727 RepID=UPI0038FC548B